MRSSNILGLRLGLLSDEVQSEDERRAAGEEGEVVEAPVAQEEPAADSLESDLIEIQDTESEGEAHDDMVERAVDTHEALENLVLSMQTAMESGGLGRDAARIATAYAGTLLSGVGMADTSRVMPALESFGGVASRSNSTRLAIESIGEQAKKLWARIMEQISKAVEWVRNYLLQVFSAGDKVLKRAESMKASIEALGNKKAEATELDRANVAKAVSIGGKPTLDGLKELEEVTKQVNGAWPEITEKGGKAIADFLAQCAEDKAPADLAFGILDNFKSFSGRNAASGGGEGFTMYETDELPGGMVLFGKVSDSKEAAKQAEQEAGLKSVGEGKEAAKLKVLTKDEMSRLVNDVISVAKMMSEYRHAANKFDPIAKSLTASAKKLSVSKFAQFTGNMKATAGSKDIGEVAEKSQAHHDNSAARNASARLAQKSVTLLQGVPAKFYAYGTSTLRAYLDWAQLSLQAYKGDKKADAAQAADDKKWADDKKAAAKGDKSE